MTDPTTIVCPHCGALNRATGDRPALHAKCGSCHLALFDGHPAAMDEAPPVSAHLGGRGFPALFLFRGGQTPTQTPGARDANAIIGRVQQHLAGAIHERSVS